MSRTTAHRLELEQQVKTEQVKVTELKAQLAEVAELTVDPLVTVFMTAEGIQKPCAVVLVSELTAILDKSSK